MKAAGCLSPETAHHLSGALEEPLQQHVDSRSVPVFQEHHRSSHSACVLQLWGLSLYSLGEKSVALVQSRETALPWELFLCFRALVADEFLEQSLHLSSPTHCGCLALEAAPLPSSFASQQLGHPAATTAWTEGHPPAQRSGLSSPAPESRRGAMP